jgi:tripartite-type tricarboxylate transporter receptor subunit TctC
VPTLSKSGLPGFEMATTTGLFAPKDVASDILQRMEGDVIKALQRPDVADQYRKLSFEVLAGDQAALDAHVQLESAKWGKVIRERGIKLTQ